MILDIHTHRVPLDPSAALVSCCMKDRAVVSLPIPYLSVGIHPWFLTEEDWQRQITWVQTCVTDPRIIALGEAGLDKVCMTPFDLQMKAFREMILLSETYRLPLFIHAVKTSHEIIALKKELLPRQPWIIHGFRGKKELAQSYLRKGFYLSFGERFQEEALVITPSDKLFVETDESTTDILNIYAKVASVRRISVSELQGSIAENTNRLFFKR